MTVDAPRRPSSAAGIDGIASLVIERHATDFAARLAADDALGVHAASTDGDSESRPVRELQVQAAEPAEAGLFDGLIGAVFGFLFG